MYIYLSICKCIECLSLYVFKSYYFHVHVGARAFYVVISNLEDDSSRSLPSPPLPPGPRTPPRARQRGSSGRDSGRLRGRRCARGSPPALVPPAAFTGDALVGLSPSKYNHGNSSVSLFKIRIFLWRELRKDFPISTKFIYVY